MNGLMRLQLLHGSLLLFLTLNASATVLHVDVNSPNPDAPYTNWATAARVIQDAVDAAMFGDEVLVTNGIYISGGRSVGCNLLVNRVAVDKMLTLRSVNGPQFTAIEGFQLPGLTNGAGAVRCVYLADGATLSGFTITNGATRDDYMSPAIFSESSGGGVWCETGNAWISNCVLAGNSSYYSGGGVCGGTLLDCTLAGNTSRLGAGARESALSNCRLSANSATESGGGAYVSTLDNCLLSGNSAGETGGGACSGTLNFCTLIGNSAGSSGGAASQATLNNCTVTGNEASRGGGAYESTLNACAVSLNSVRDSGGGTSGGALNNCTLTGNSARYAAGGTS